MCKKIPSNPFLRIPHLESQDEVNCCCNSFPAAFQASKLKSVKNPKFPFLLSFGPQVAELKDYLEPKIEGLSFCIDFLEEEQVQWGCWPC